MVDFLTGVEVQTEEAWGFAEEFALPRLLVVNKLDRENASFGRALESIGKAFGRQAVALQIPPCLFRETILRTACRLPLRPPKC